MTTKRISGDGKKNLEFFIKGFETNNVAKVGWMQRKAYANGEYVAAVAAQNEFGNSAKNIPPRPFMRYTIEKYQHAWRDTIAKGSQAILKNKKTFSQVLEIVAAKAAGNFQLTISSSENPPMKPLKSSTIKARLSRRSNQKTVGKLDKPLVDTGYLLSTLTYSVEKE